MDIANLWLEWIGNMISPTFIYTCIKGIILLIFLCNLCLTVVSLVTEQPTSLNEKENLDGN